MTTTYSGETTYHAPLRGTDKWKETPGVGGDCIQEVSMLMLDHKSVPKTVAAEVLHEIQDLHTLYYGRIHWDTSGDYDEASAANYAPDLTAYLLRLGLEYCWVYAGRNSPYNKHLPQPNEYGISSVMVFEVQWSNCPVEVIPDVVKLWENTDLYNDNYFFPWNGSDRLNWEYPLIAEYLKSRNVNECLIRWWW